jgi:hypothetical protein
MVACALTLPLGLFGVLLFGGVHSDFEGKWYGQLLVIASFALSIVPIWVARVVWRRMGKD